MYVRKRSAPLPRTPKTSAPPTTTPSLSAVPFTPPSPPIPTERPAIAPSEAVADATALPFRTPHSPFGKMPNSVVASVQASPEQVKAAQSEQSDGDFQENTPKTGYLKVETFIADRAAPVAGVNILISKIIDGAERIFFNAQTNESGIINDIRLPAPEARTSLSPDQPFPYATYLLSAAKRGFLLVPPMEIQIFEGVKTIGRVPMQLDLQGGERDAAL